MSSNEKIGVRQVKAVRKREEKLVACTAYDVCFGRLADQAGVDVILVGDSLGMTVLGYKNTVPVTLDDCLHHTAAVVRGVKRAMVVGDMPFMTYQVSEEEALKNAARFLQEAGADAVKLEGGRKMVPVIERLTSVGIPVMGHLGILPQSVLGEGGYRVIGKKNEEKEALLADAKAIENAGVFAMVLEGVPMDVTREITQSVSVPTIGIGAGPYCDGQIQVIHDMLGLFPEFSPRHAKKYESMGERVQLALEQYAQEVRKEKFPTREYGFE
jgi:3-methyl-2-oxobutanoate hydroxymethyltransferase